MRHRADHFALYRQQALKVAGHAVECLRQPPHRIGAGGRHACFQIATGDTRGGAFHFAHTPFELAHQQVDGEPDQRQPEHADYDQQLRRIRVQLMQRAQRHDPGRSGNRGEHADGITPLVQRHHRVALIETTALIVVEAGAVAGEQFQRIAEAAGFFQCSQALRLFGFGIADQLIDQQINGRSRQLFADLFDLAGEHQPIGGADQGKYRDAMRAHLLDQHLATQQAGFQPTLQADVIQGTHAQRDAQQAAP